MMSILVSAAAVAGLLLLLPRPVEGVLAALTLGVVTAVWAIVWHALLTPAGSVLTAIGAPANAVRLQIAVNVAAAASAWGVAAAVLWLSQRFVSRNPLSRATTMIVGAFWAAGMILVQLGQEGAWPPESIALAAVVLCLALALGALLPSTRRQAGEEMA